MQKAWTSFFWNKSSSSDTMRYNMPWFWVYTYLQDPWKACENVVPRGSIERPCVLRLLFILVFSGVIITYLMIFMGTNTEKNEMAQVSITMLGPNIGLCRPSTLIVNKFSTVIGGKVCNLVKIQMKKNSATLISAHFAEFSILMSLTNIIIIFTLTLYGICRAVSHTVSFRLAFSQFPQSQNLQY